MLTEARLERAIAFPFVHPNKFHERAAGGDVAAVYLSPRSVALVIGKLADFGGSPADDVLALCCTARLWVRLGVGKGKQAVAVGGRRTKEICRVTAGRLAGSGWGRRTGDPRSCRRQVYAVVSWLTRGCR